MTVNVLKAILLSLFLIIPSSAVQRIFNVSSVDELETLIESKKLSAGDEIVWAAGEYQDVDLDVEGVDGTENQLITLRASAPGAVIFRGESQFKIGAKWWVIQGLHFSGSENEINSYNTFQFRSNGGIIESSEIICRCVAASGNDNETIWIGSSKDQTRVLDALSVRITSFAVAAKRKSSAANQATTYLNGTLFANATERASRARRWQLLLRRWRRRCWRHSDRR